MQVDQTAEQVIVLLRAELEDAREQLAVFEQQLKSADDENAKLIKDNMSLRYELESLHQ